MKILSVLLCALLYCADALGQGIRLPHFSITSVDDRQSLLIGSMHTGFSLEGQIDPVLVSRIGGYRRVYFEALPWSSDYQERVREALRSASPNVVGRVDVLAERLAQIQTRNVRLAAIAKEVGDRLATSYLLLHYQVLDTCAPQDYNYRSLDHEIHELVKHSSIVEALEDPATSFGFVNEVTEYQWMSHLDAVLKFAAEGGCEQIIRRYLSRQSRYLSLGLVTEIVDEMRRFHEDSLKSRIVFLAFEKSSKREEYLAERIVQAHVAGSAAFIVGASHLDDLGGLVKSLRSKGFTVSRQ